LFLGLFSRGKSQILRMAVPIQMLCDFLETLPDNSEALSSEVDDSQVDDSQVDNSQFLHPANDTPTLSHQGTDDFLSSSALDHSQDSQSQTDEHAEGAESQNGHDEIGAGAINVASSIVTCCLTQLGKLHVLQSNCKFFLLFIACFNNK
jgi:hypothetical protein